MKYKWLQSIVANTWDDFGVPLGRFGSQQQDASDMPEHKWHQSEILSSLRWVRPRFILPQQLSSASSVLTGQQPKHELQF